MADCQFCKDNSAAKDLLPGEETTCFWCGRRITGRDKVAPAPGAKVSKPAPVPTKGLDKPKKTPLSEYPPIEDGFDDDDIPDEELVDEFDDDEDEVAPPAMGPGTAKQLVPPQFTGPARLRPSEPEEDEQLEEDTSFLGRLRKLDTPTASAFFCGTMALLFASVPGMSLLTKPLSAVGLVVAVFGSLLPARSRRADVRFPTLVTGLCIVVFLFAGSWPRGSTPPPPPLASVPRDKSTSAAQVLDEGAWVDAASGSILLQDLRARVVKAGVGPVELQFKDTKYKTQQKYLVIRVHVTVESVFVKVVPYESWADTATAPSKNPALLTDDANRVIPQKTFGADRKIPAQLGRAEAITPGRALDQVLIFPAPEGNVPFVKLTLPAAAFGQKGEFRFQVPWTMVEQAK